MIGAFVGGALFGAVLTVFVFALGFAAGNNKDV